ncbi:MAG: phage terminase large subunit [Candidatus Bathyarchaeia archaeon]
MTTIGAMLNRIFRNPWIPVEPTPKQLEFLLIDSLEAFYGGAAGGGKSESLLIGAAMYLEEPDYHAIIFRKDTKELKLEGGLIPRSHEWWAGRARWNGETLTWTFPSGSTVSFGYLNNPNDHVRYGSTEYQYIGFDELPELLEEHYRFMFSRLRRTSRQKMLGIPLRVRAAGNPIGPGVQWVKTRFNLPEGRPDRPFVPARLEDNPHLDREAYEESLANLDPVTRARLREGDWSIRDVGRMFRRSWFTLVDKIPAGSRGVRYWDLAATEDAGSYTVGAMLATPGDGRVYIVDILRKQLRPKAVQDLVLQTAALDAERKELTHIDIWMEQEPGSSGKAEIDRYARLLAGYPFRGDKVTGSKEVRARPLSSYAEAGNIYIYPEGWDVDALLDEFEAFPESKYKDQVDASSGAFEKLMRPRKERARYRGRVW